MPPVSGFDGWDFAPMGLAIMPFLFRYLRYRIKYQGQWVVEIRDQDRETLAESVTRNRATAVQLFEVAVDKSAHLAAVDVAAALE
ncbi:MAG: hypothetical protein FWD95_14915 [Nocardioidaceae bacterium]|nr:hypothetical protein [Nocardioidaceae bacterium]